jgi:hypothetical protein
LAALNGQLYTYDLFPVDLEEGAQIIQLDPTSGHTLATINPIDPLNGWLPDHSVHQSLNGSFTFRGSDRTAFLATGHDYGYAPDPGAQLSRLDGTLSQLTRIGHTTQNANQLLIEALAFDGNNVLYALNQPTVSGIPISLWTIDPTTGVMILVGSLGFSSANPNSLNPMGMVFDSSGNLFVSLNSGDNSYGQPSLLYSVNKSTGGATLIGPVGFNDVVGLADLVVSGTPAIINGGFDNTGNFFGWTVSGTGSSQITGANVYSGPYAAVFNETAATLVNGTIVFGTTNLLSQTLLTQPGASYVLSFAVNGIAGGYCYVSWNGSPVGQSQFNPGWTMFHYVVKATSANTVLQFYIPDVYNEAQTIAIDSVSVVPPPQISAQRIGGSQAQLQAFTGTVGANYALDRATSLTPPINWVPQLTNLSDAFGNVTFTNTPSATANNFWRFRSLP